MLKQKIVDLIDYVDVLYLFWKNSQNLNINKFDSYMKSAIANLTKTQ